MQSSPKRTKLITLIHVAKKELALNEDSYRGLLEGATGKNSLREMKLKDLEAVVERFKDFGFKKKKSKPKRAGIRKPANTEHARLIRALWLSLYHMGEVKDSSEDAMSAYVMRMTKIDDMQWLTDFQAQKAISGLREWMKRAGYIRPTDEDLKLFCRYNFDEKKAHLNAAHVLMAQSKIAFKTFELFQNFLLEEGIDKNTHPYALTLDETYFLTEKLSTVIRNMRGYSRG